MTEKTYEVNILTRVTDEEQLFKTAANQASSTGMTVEQIGEMLRTPDNKVNVSACLRIVLDPGASPPGCEILDSTCA